ncbi:MAG: Ldh family oxidoreductase, partial [Pseudomonadota bacterium]
KGWSLGLLVEVMAAALTGSVSSRDVAGLKLPDGAPHDLGQTYILIKPTVFSERFGAALEDLKAAVAADPDARLPGQAREPMESVDVPENLWELTLRLSG